MLIIDKADNFKHTRTRKIKFNKSQMCGFKVILFNICSVLNRKGGRGEIKWQVN